METKIIEISQKSKDEILSNQEKFHNELKVTIYLKGTYMILGY